MIDSSIVSTDVEGAGASIAESVVTDVSPEGALAPEADSGSLDATDSSTTDSSMTPQQTLAQIRLILKEAQLQLKEISEQQQQMASTVNILRESTSLESRNRAVERAIAATAPFGDPAAQSSVNTDNESPGTSDFLSGMRRSFWQ